jgi:hypothetical protein
MWKLTALIVTALALLPMAPAQAQLARTYVAAGGNDANDCDRLTPCRTFQRAHDATMAGGGITVLGSADYQPVTISKAISIVNDGIAEAGIRVSFGAIGITINAGSNDSINLRGLNIRGFDAGGGTGIAFNSGKSLTVENCTIRNLTKGGVGIQFGPSASSNLAISNTLVFDNGWGIVIHPLGNAGPTVKASLNRVAVHNSEVNGINVSVGSGMTLVNVVDSLSTNNGSTGIVIGGPQSGAGIITVVRSVVADNGWVGLSAFNPTATLRIGESRLTGNAKTWQSFSGGSVRSYGNNNINGNADGDPALPGTPLR